MEMSSQIHSKGHILLLEAFICITSWSRKFGDNLGTKACYVVHQLQGPESEPHDWASGLSPANQS